MGGLIVVEEDLSFSESSREVLWLSVKFFLKMGEVPGVLTESRYLLDLRGDGI